MLEPVAGVRHGRCSSGDRVGSAVAASMAARSACSPRLTRARAVSWLMSSAFDERPVALFLDHAQAHRFALVDGQRLELLGDAVAQLARSCELLDALVLDVGQRAALDPETRERASLRAVSPEVVGQLMAGDAIQPRPAQRRRRAHGSDDGPRAPRRTSRPGCPPPPPDPRCGGPGTPGSPPRDGHRGPRFPQRSKPYDILTKGLGHTRESDEPPIL